MRKRRIASSETWTRLLAGLGLIGACTVVDKGDYTFTDNPEETGGTAGASAGDAGRGGSAGSTSGAAGRGGGSSGEAGDGGGAIGGTGGTAGEAGGGSGGEGGVCDPNPCQHGGTCTNNGGMAECDCALGYEGPECEDEIDECDPNPCRHNEPCTDLVGDFKCDCMPIDAGKSCELPRFQPVGGPGGMGSASAARAVSADGTIVVGHFIDGMGFAKPFIWTVERGAQPLPLPMALRFDMNFYPTALSGDGARWAGYYQGTGAGEFARPLGGTMTMSAELLTPTGGRGGTPFDIDGGGVKVVGIFFDATNTESHAGQWTDPMRAVTPLPSPFGQGSQSSAGAVTRDGAIVTGIAKDTQGQVLIVSWVDDPDVDPPPTRRMTMMGVWNAEVHGVSSDGSFAVGTYMDSAGSPFAFATQATTAVNIAPLDGAVLARSNVYDVSDEGTVLVGDVYITAGMTSTPYSQACTWTHSPTQDITSYKGTVVEALRNTGVQLPNWQLTTAYGVSADGKTVVGSAVDPSGNSVGFIARLP